MRASVSAQLGWRLLLTVFVSTGIAVWAQSGGLGPMLSGCLGVFAGILCGAALIAHWWRRVGDVIRAMQTGIGALQDGEFAVAVHESGRDELTDLVRAHNRLGTVLRRQRQHLQERELLLDTVVAQSPLALVLFDPGGHVVMANLEARQLLGDGRRLEGHGREEVASALPPVLAEAVRADRDGLVTLELDEREETLHIAHQRFTLNARPHHLLLVKQLTREISRQEIAIWKKVIRIISHEINNSLGPIKSLARSGLEEAQADGDALYERILGTIGERADHLLGFLEGYVRMAKLPTPEPQHVPLGPWLERLKDAWAFKVEGEAQSGWFDPILMEQAMINLLKNAHESGSDPAEISLRLEQGARCLGLSVLDRGPGMNREVLAQAMLPFYSTKRQGSGVGLALVREIVEAHGGHIDLRNRRAGGLAVSLTLPAASASAADG